MDDAERLVGRVGLYCRWWQTLAQDPTAFSYEAMTPEEVEWNNSAAYNEQELRRLCQTLHENDVNWRQWVGDWSEEAIERVESIMNEFH